MPDSETNPGAAAQGPDDEALLAARARDGDAAAFSSLYERYVRRVYRYLYSRVGDPADAEDLTSQTFLRALKSMPRYRHRGRFSAWLFAIAHNQAVDHFRRSRPQGPLEPQTEAGPDSDPSVRVIAALETRNLSERIGMLSEGERELLRLRYVADLSHDEIGKVLHKSAGAVKKSIYRTLARLQQQMENEHE